MNIESEMNSEYKQVEHNSQKYILIESENEVCFKCDLLIANKLGSSCSAPDLDCEGGYFKKVNCNVAKFENPLYNKIADECGLHIAENNLKVTYKEIEYFVDQVLKSKGVN